MQSLDFVDKEFENNYLMYAEISVGKTWERTKGNQVNHIWIKWQYQK